MKFVPGTTAHPHNALNAAKVRSLREPGRYADGNGLYLKVDPSGAKRWILRTVVKGRRRDIGLGGARVVSLSEARRQAMEFRAVARSGGDPLEERRAASKVTPSFDEAARIVHRARSKAWRNQKHADQWINTVRKYASPDFGERPLDQISTPDILKVLGPLWLTKPETARRLKQRLAAIFDWAKAARHITGENPVSGVSKGLPKQPDKKSHHRAMGADDVPAFIASLRDVRTDRASALALEFAILTAARTSEALHAQWSEIDFDKAIWTIPAARMKAGKEHRVPLSDRCLEILYDAQASFAASSHVFHGVREGKPLSNMALLQRMRRMGRSETVHGFRSSFRDWAAERTSFPNEVCEMALAHAVRDKAEAAYRRGDLFEKRRKLMAAWSQFCGSDTATVVTFNRA